MRRRPRRAQRRILAGELAAALFLILLFISLRPRVAGTVLLFIPALLFAGALAWQGVMASWAAERRVRIAIARILSDGRARDRQEIEPEVCAQILPLRYLPLRWFRLPDRALNALVREGLLERASRGSYQARPR